MAVGTAAALWLMACGGGGGTTGSGGGSTTSTTTTTTATTTSGTGGTGGSTTTSGTGGTGGSMGNCTEVTVTKTTRVLYDEQSNASVFQLTLGTMLGDAATLDLGQLEFYDLMISGKIDLSAGDEANYATCKTCVRVLEDADAAAGTVGKFYFQKSGSVDLGTSALPSVTGGIDDVTLVEVTIDPMTFESTPVEGGACLHITKVDFAFDAIPGTWTCDPNGYGDHGACDCGDCGVKDPDCADATNPVSGCLDGQTCATGTKCEGVPTAWTCDKAKYGGGAGNGCDCACGAPDPDCDLMGEAVKGCMANEACTGGVCIPEGWTCDPTYYKDGTYCDCACGAYDPDCMDPNATLFGCLDGQTCPTGLKCEGVPTAWTCDAAQYGGGAGNGCDCKCGAPDPDCDLMGETVKNCAAGEKCGGDACYPAAWTCKPSYYNDSVCDCGCGVLDPDCADSKVASCAFCDDMGSCSADACPGSIDPNNNAVCN
ncbi:MAG: hypothetical protein U0359_23280 [Byssovorax sp.]